MNPLFKPANRAIHCQNLIFRARKPRPGRKRGEPIDGLDTLQRMVLLVLSDMIGSNKDAWTVCQKEIAERAGCGRTAVSRAITSLTKAGILRANYKGSSSVLTYTVDTEPLAKLQREPRGSSREQRKSPAACSQTERPLFAERTASVRETNSTCSQNEHETVPSSVPRPPEGTLPQQGGVQRTGQGEPHPKKTPATTTLIDELPARYQTLALEVQKEVTLHESRIPTTQLALELTEFFDAWEGKVEARDLINALQSPCWKGLTQLSWGLILRSDDLLSRLINQVGAAIQEREKAANARNTPAETVAGMLQSADPCERLQGVNCYADRWERTKDSTWLVRLATVFSGKGRDELLKVRAQALNRLYTILGRDNPELPEPVRRGLVIALRSAAREDELRIIASSAIEFCQEVSHA